MDVDQFSKEFQNIWHSKPAAIILLLLGVVLFVFLVVDAWKHKRRRKGPRMH